MATPIRWFEPDCVYFVTSRCMQSRMLMRPDATTNELVGAALARASRLYDVEIFAFVFASNHFHLMIRARDHWRIARFMQFLQSNIARKVGRWVRWTGRFFSRRYSASRDQVSHESRRDTLLGGWPKTRLARSTAGL